MKHMPNKNIPELDTFIFDISEILVADLCFIMGLSWHYLHL